MPNISVLNYLPNRRDAAILRKVLSNLTPQSIALLDDLSSRNDAALVRRAVQRYLDGLPDLPAILNNHSDIDTARIIRLALTGSTGAGVNTAFGRVAGGSPALTVTPSGNNFTLAHDAAAPAQAAIYTLQPITSGKKYFDVAITGTVGVGVTIAVGVASAAAALAPATLAAIGGVNAVYANTGAVSISGAAGTPQLTYTAGDKISVAVDASTGKVWFGKNNVFIGDPVAGTGQAATLAVGPGLMPYVLLPAGSQVIVGVAAVGPGSYAAPTGYTFVGGSVAPTYPTTGLVSYHDTSITASHPGTGALWKNVVTAPADGAAQTDYDWNLTTMTFNGTAGTEAAYLLTNGGYGRMTVGTAFTKGQHRAAAEWTEVVLVRMPAGTGSGVIPLYDSGATDQGGSDMSKGVSLWRLDFSASVSRIKSDSAATALEIVSAANLPYGTANYVLLIHSYKAGASSFMWRNAGYDPVSGTGLNTYTATLTSPNAQDAPGQPSLGSRSDTTQRVPSDTRLKARMQYNRQISAAEAAQIAAYFATRIAP